MLTGAALLENLTSLGLLLGRNGFNDLRSRLE